MAWVSESREAVRATRAGGPRPRRWTSAVRVAALMSAVLIAGGLLSAPQAFAAAAPNAPALPGLPVPPAPPGPTLAPGAPTAVTAKAGNASATVS